MDKHTLKMEVDTVMTDVIGIIERQSDDKLKEEIRPGAWTIGQLAWHVVMASEGMAEVHTEKVNRPYDKWVGEIRSTFLNYQAKYNSPPFLIPEERTYTVAEVTKALKKNHAAQLKSIEANDLTETITDIQLPGWGALTRFEWTKLLVYHVTRHVDQLRAYTK